MNFKINPALLSSLHSEAMRLKCQLCVLVEASPAPFGSWGPGAIQLRLKTPNGRTVCEVAGAPGDLEGLAMKLVFAAKLK